MPDTSMIERVARRLARYEAVGVDDEHRGMARAAIEAMREPTDAMVEVSHHVAQAEFAWTAMIDEALRT